jgi:hypothetical protein
MPSGGVVRAEGHPEFELADTAQQQSLAKNPSGVAEFCGTGVPPTWSSS